MEREKRTLLVVDGNMSMLYYLGMLLTRFGYKVSTARTAEEALRMMDDSLPSLVIAELNLPRMNGHSLLGRMRERPNFAAIPVIILTSDNDPMIKDTCLRAGCASFFSKPVDPDSLYNYKAIQSACEELPRKHIRLSTSLKVVIGDGGILGGVKRTEYATAISEGGLYVRTLYPQPVNTLTPLTLFMPDRDISAMAVVLYNFTVGEGPFKEPGMGMKFVDISADDRAAIKTFIWRQLLEGIEEKEAEGRVV